MIFLKSERDAFELVKAKFTDKYTELLQAMFDTSKEKGKIRDVNSPIHHRQSPISMLSIAQAKCRRIESILSRSGWEERQPRLEDVIEECVDIANYVLYLASLCSLLLEEERK